jgi:galactose mutarotase-like enzyme
VRCGPGAVPLTGQQYQIATGQYRATVTELGAGLRELLFRDQPVIAGYGPDELPRGGAGQLLAPWPNLDRDGDGRAWAYLAAGGGAGARAGLWVGAGYCWLQVFTGDALTPDRRRKAVAIEPMTCPPNAFVTGDDLLVLQPGEATAHTWGIRAFND